jgi:hypothetical protein
LWYRANKTGDTLPPKYQHATLPEITKDIGVGFHAVVPDFRDLRGPDDDIDKAFGLYNLKTMPYRTILENVERSVIKNGDKTFVEYKTPLGVIKTTTLYDQGMQKAGISISHIVEHSFKGVQDYPALGYLFENARVVPNYDGYLKFKEKVGETGLAVAFVSLAASPMHLIQRELMPLELFFYETYDHPEQLARLARQIGLYWDRVFDVVSGCPAEVIFLGANYDVSVTYPRFFQEHIQPWLQKFARKVHQEGKYLLTHTDGENNGLLQHYLDSEIDIADSICPAPMTKLSFGAVRDFFKGKITIMGGIPSIALLKSSMSDRDFDVFLDNFFRQIGNGDHLILGISDTTPPQSDFERILKISKRVASFGPVPG